MLIALFVSSFVILGVSMMFKFVSVNWLSQVKRFLYTENTGMVNNMINSQFENIYNIDRRNFFEGDENSFSFVTRDSGTFIPGTTQVFYSYEDDKFTVCFKPVKNFNDLLRKIDDFEDDSCLNLESVKNAKFNYLIKQGEDYEWKDAVKDRIPSAVLMEIEIKKLDTSFTKDIYALSGQ